MKTIFYLSDVTIDEDEKYINEDLIPSGFIINEHKDVCKIIDKEIHLGVGDRICLYGYRIVNWKAIDIDSDIIEYYVNEE